MKEIIIRYLLVLIVVFLSGTFSFLLLPLTLYTSYFLLQLFLPVTVLGNVLTISTFSFTFVDACAATLAYVLLIVLILLTRDISFPQGLKMFLLGAASIFLLNILRIIFLVYLYVDFGKDYFAFAHLFLWHVVSTIFVAVVWILLVEYYHIESIPIVSEIKEILKK